MSSIHNNLQANLLQNQQATQTTQDTGDVQGGSAVAHVPQLSPGEMGQSDALQPTVKGWRGNVLSSPPPATAATGAVKAQDLQSGQAKLKDLSTNFSHPVTGALILASEQGSAQSSSKAAISGLAGEAAGAGAATAQSPAASPTIDATQTSGNGGNTSITNTALTSSSAASSSSGSSSSSTSGSIFQSITTNLDDAANNPVAQAASNLITQASTAPDTGKCHNNKKTESQKADSIASATGLSHDQSLHLLRAMNQNYSANGSTDGKYVSSTEQTILASAIETMQQMKNNGQGNSQAAQQLRGTLGNAANEIKTANSQEQFAGDNLSSYQSNMNQLASDVTQVGGGTTSTLSTATSSAPTLEGPQLVDPNDP